MEILVLGGTGAMGVPLVEMLSEQKHQVYVTTRSEKPNEGNVVYLHGNAKNDAFFSQLMKRNYDVIVDFMVYSTNEFRNRVQTFLDHTDHYFFFSSARCYADSEVPITEKSSRLVDVCQNEEYLALDEYGMAKGRQENLLFQSGKQNWTIIRPYITYNSYRLQLGVYEKEDWLRRALSGKTVVFPKDIAEKTTSMTFGPELVGALVKLIGNPKALGQAFHITTAESHTWNEILQLYCRVIKVRTGKAPKILMPDDSSGLQTAWNKWQIKYDRLFNRTFDNTKIESVIGKYPYHPTFEGLEECLTAFIENPRWLGVNVKYEAWCDRQAKEFTTLKLFPGMKNKLKYLRYRFF